MLLFKLLLCILITGLFLYSKLLPYKDRLNNKYKNIFNFFSGIFQPATRFLGTSVKPFTVGTGLAVDMTQVVLLIFLLLILLIL